MTEITVKDRINIGLLEIRGFTALAPLAGVTDIPFRLICREMGAPVVFSEMVSSEGLVRGSKTTNRYLEFLEEERPIALQLFGADPETMRTAAQIIEKKCSPDIIDVNFGCPVKKIIKKDAGSALLKNPLLMGRIVKAVSDSVSIPVTAKIRSGWDENHKPVSEIGKILEESGIAAITLHARTRSQQFSGKAQWDEIRTLKEAVSVPVIGNGDVMTPYDARQMLHETGCDLVMIGRGSMGNPWIFREVEHYLLTGTILPPPATAERIDACIRQCRLSVKLYGKVSASNTMKKHTAWYIKGLPDSAKIKQQLFLSRSIDEMIYLLKNYKEKLIQYVPERQIPAEKIVI